MIHSEMARARRTSLPQRGVTMVEALVALVVLSVGMLGIAGLYVSSLQAGRTALTRTQAVNLVNDMIDRIRANANARILYANASYGGGPAVQGCVVTNNCSVAALAQDDLANWILAAQAALPGVPTAVVTFTPAAATGRPDRYQVTVTWQEAGNETARDATTGALQNLTYTANLSMIPSVP
jgi:type IV pilus assembly protein PilV